MSSADAVVDVDGDVDEDSSSFRRSRAAHAAGDVGSGVIVVDAP